jgi:hypothetical protein
MGLVENKGSEHTLGRLCLSGFGECFQSVVESLVLFSLLGNTF